MTKGESFGGVLINRNLQILLFRPTNQIGGYAWTFPEGRQSPDETPEETALREVEEKTGYTAEIVGEVAKSLEGDVTTTEFFIMRPLVRGEFDSETAEICWGSPDHARQLINETPDEIGRKQNLAILAEIEKQLDSPYSPQATERKRATDPRAVSEQATTKKVLCICYEFSEEGEQDYVGIANAIKELGSSCRPMPSVWLVDTDLRPSQITDWLHKYQCGPHDKLVVFHVAVGSDWALCGGSDHDEATAVWMQDRVRQH